MSHSRLLDAALRYFRSKRMRLFQQTFQFSSRTRILDLGGSPFIWQFSPVQPDLTILNFPSALEPGSHWAKQVAGDGRMLPFPDAAFDIVFSNSVIEHVGDRADQTKFANEVARVGRHYWIQTPNRCFPIEVHVILPLIHYLPKTYQRWIVNRFTIWQLLVRPTEEQRGFYVNHFVNELNLLAASDLQALFPDSTILSERVCGLAKSLVALRA